MKTEISAIKKAHKQALATDVEDREVWEARRKQQKSLEIERNRNKVRRDMLTAIKAVGGYEGILKTLNDEVKWRGALTSPIKISLSQKAFNWINRYQHLSRNPLAALFKELERQGFKVRYRDGWISYDSGGHHDGGTYFPGYAEKYSEPPYIEIIFPKE